MANLAAGHCVCWARPGRRGKLDLIESGLCGLKEGGPESRNFTRKQYCARVGSKKLRPTRTNDAADDLTTVVAHLEDLFFRSFAKHDHNVPSLTTFRSGATHGHRSFVSLDALMSRIVASFGTFLR
jgi:hypothetical protein